VDVPAEGVDPVLESMKEAVVVLAEAGIDIHDPLGDHQFTLRGDERIPVNGGSQREGSTNIVSYSTFYKSTLANAHPHGTIISDRTGMTDLGYPINYGSSFMLAVIWTDEGPTARSLLALSQSSEPTSPHYTDGTWMFSDHPGQLDPVVPPDGSATVLSPPGGYDPVALRHRVGVVELADEPCVRGLAVRISKLEARL
jgi:acyl-homoserine-lactone acylase